MAFKEQITPRVSSRHLSSLARSLLHKARDALTRICYLMLERSYFVEITKKTAAQQEVIRTALFKIRDSLTGIYFIFVIILQHGIQM